MTRRGSSESSFSPHFTSMAMPARVSAVITPMVKKCDPTLHAMTAQLVTDERPRRQLGVLGFEQEGVEPAAMIDGLERIGGNAQPHQAKRFRGM
jgi:hypothetical protein